MYFIRLIHFQTAVVNVEDSLNEYLKLWLKPQNTNTVRTILLLLKLMGAGLSL